MSIHRMLSRSLLTAGFFAAVAFVPVMAGKGMHLAETPGFEENVRTVNKYVMRYDAAKEMQEQANAAIDSINEYCNAQTAEPPKECGQSKYKFKYQQYQEMPTAAAAS